MRIIPRFICRRFGHAWHRDQSMGWKYDPAWRGGEGPPPIVSSWVGEECGLCGETRRIDRTYDSPTEVRTFVQGQLGGRPE